jgi:hypothetical protein
LPEQIKPLGRFFGQANDAARSHDGHFPSACAARQCASGVSKEGDARDNERSRRQTEQLKKNG